MHASISVLATIAIVAMGLTLIFPIYSVLLFDLLLTPVVGESQIAGVRLTSTDVVFLVLFLGILVRGTFSFQKIRSEIPHLGLWLALGIFMSIAYLTAPINQQHLTAFHRGVYQVFRFAWKPILYFPLAAVFFGSYGRSRAALYALVVGGSLCAMIAIPQGYRGVTGTGPFGHGNTLGAVLIAPFLVSLGRIIIPQSRRERVFFAISLLVIGRGLLFTSSRGAYASVLGGAAFLMWQLTSRSAGRARLARLIPVGLTALALVLVLKPDILERPTVRQFLTTAKPLEQSTLEWRIQERWPFYWEKIKAQPWLGYGTTVDVSLAGRGAKTPHNGYLALAVSRGLPAAALYVILALLAIYHGTRHFRRNPVGPDSFLGLIVAAGLIGILLHNLVDAVIMVPQVAKAFWLLAGLGAALPMVARQIEEDTGPINDERVSSRLED